MTWLESVRESEVNDIKLNSLEEEPQAWIEELYTSNPLVKFPGISKEELQEMNRDSSVAGVLHDC